MKKIDSRDLKFAQSPKAAFVVIWEEGSLFDVVYAPRWQSLHGIDGLLSVMHGLLTSRYQVMVRRRGRAARANFDKPMSEEQVGVALRTAGLIEDDSLKGAMAEKT